MVDIMIRRWSFCPDCRGASLMSCKTCGGTGKVVELIPLASLPKSLQADYAKIQKDFIREQEQTEKGGDHG